MAKCSNPECDSGQSAFSLGLCQRCYTRQRRNGTLARKRRPNNPGAMCATEGCDRRAHAKGLCSMHYQQTLDPMRVNWLVLRSRAQGDYVPTWDDFDAFLADVGPKPGERYQLRRTDVLKPWGPDNFDWREPILPNAKAGTATEDMAAYQWAWNLMRRYGLTPGEAQQIIDHQGGLCPVCQKPLGYFGPTSRKEATVIVDHDHIHDDRPRRYAVRGIMHRVCNSGMGQLGEDAANLRRAADHIDAHEHRKALGLCIIDQINQGDPPCHTSPLGY